MLTSHSTTDNTEACKEHEVETVYSLDLPVKSCLGIEPKCPGYELMAASTEGCSMASPFEP